MEFEICKWELSPTQKEVVFKNEKGSKILITEDNISNQLVERATQQGLGHCFVEAKKFDVKKKVSASQYQPATSTLNEVPTDVTDLLPVVENKRQDALAVTPKKKKGRPQKLKE